MLHGEAARQVVALEVASEIPVDKMGMEGQELVRVEAHQALAEHVMRVEMVFV
jgi:hypothetical protein